MSTFAQPRGALDTGLVASAVVGNYPSDNGWDTDPQVANESGNLSLLIQATAWATGVAKLQSCEDGTIGAAGTTWVDVPNGSFTANAVKTVPWVGKKLRLNVSVATITNLRCWVYGIGMIQKRINN